MSDSDFASITDNGRLCDPAGNLGAAEFEAAMRTQLRRFAQRRLADSLVHISSGPEFAHLAALKLLALQAPAADSRAAAAGGSSPRATLPAGVASLFTRVASGPAKAKAAAPAGSTAPGPEAPAAQVSGEWQAALLKQLAEMRGELAAARRDAADLREEMAATRADVKREAQALREELRRVTAGGGSSGGGDGGGGGDRSLVRAGGGGGGGGGGSPTAAAAKDAAAAAVSDLSGGTESEPIGGGGGAAAKDAAAVAVIDFSGEPDLVPSIGSPEPVGGGRAVGDTPRPLSPG
jgi:hypothetical protein